MLQRCVEFYEKAKKYNVPMEEMVKYKNLEKLQQTIQEEDGKFYSLGELSDTIRYCNRWN